MTGINKLNIFIFYLPSYLPLSPRGLFLWVKSTHRREFLYNGEVCTHTQTHKTNWGKYVLAAILMHTFALSGSFFFRASHCPPFSFSVSHTHESAGGEWQGMEIRLLSDLHQGQPHFHQSSHLFFSFSFLITLFSSAPSQSSDCL